MLAELEARVEERRSSLSERKKTRKRGPRRIILASSLRTARGGPPRDAEASAGFRLTSQGFAGSSMVIVPCSFTVLREGSGAKVETRTTLLA